MTGEMITDEQKRKLWEWVGFKWQGEFWVDPEGYTYNWPMNPDETPEETMPPIDLNSLFRYAIPIVDDHGAAALEWVMGEFCMAVYRHENEADALALAILKVIDGQNTDTRR